MIGTLYLRDHMAKVRILYDARRYSIRYQDSSNLKYNPDTKTIHSNYNSWVQNLDNAIRSQLSIRR
ncbi:putative lipoprotein [Thiorhodococcus drewsii AZ1]|uniref:Putative lipoprotein n=1 Tax=Thiorhodococcus drewsii AZ1 TaxID=765913 RepID=G2DXC4_9GAMM|nr:putative lipoprotein [Thiorhodococcus drewsii AZ1]